MKPHRSALVGFGVVLLPLAVVTNVPLAGCSSDDASSASFEDAEAAVVDGPAPDANIDELDASSRDARSDSDADAADADASDAEAGDGGPACTEGGWCVTDLPADAGTLTLADVWANREEAWAVANEGHVLHWTSGHWSVAWNAGLALRGVLRDHAGRVWVVGEGGHVFRHAPGAPDSEWSPVATGVAMNYVAICEGPTSASLPENLWIAASQTLLVRWTGTMQDNGLDPIWHYVPLGGIDIGGLSCSSDDVWAVGLDLSNYGTALMRVRSDESWTKTTGLPATAFARPFTSVFAWSETDLWLMDINKIVHGTTVTPAAWSTYPVGSWYYGSPTDWDVWGGSPSDVWIVGRHGHIYHYDGTSLTPSITSTNGVLMTKSFHGISGTSADDLWVVGEDIALHRTSKK